MSGSYAVGANYLGFTAGSAGAAGTGAFTVVALVQGGVGNNNAGFVGLYASATLTRAIFEDTNHLYGVNDFTGGYGTLTQGTWYVVAQTKPSASAPWRFHYWAWNSTPSGAFSHGTEVGAGNQGNGSAITAVRIGANAVNANGLIAAVGIWTSELSDGQIDTLVSANLSDWAALSPAELISLENWTGTTGAVVNVGTSTFSAVTGTVSSGANPSGFNFSTGATTVNGAVAFSSSPTLTAAATLTQFPAVAFSAAPTLTAGGTRVQPATASFTAAPTLSAAAFRDDRSAAVGFNASPVLAVSAGGLVAATVAFTAAPLLTVAGTVVKLATASFTAAPTLSAAVTRVQLGLVGFTAAPLLTLGGLVIRPAVVVFSARPVLTAAAQVGPIVPYATAVLTPGAASSAALTPSAAAGATLTPGAITPATLTASTF